MSTGPAEELEWQTRKERLGTKLVVRGMLASFNPPAMHYWPVDQSKTAERIAA